MRGALLIAALPLAACGEAPQASNAAPGTAVVTAALPAEPLAPWAGAGGALIERRCTACHSAEMIANQPPLAADKWQTTIDKMRTVYRAQIAESDDSALVAALMAAQKRP